jgi:dethiobiotin synthetase
MNKHIMVAGIGTEVGKTVVSAILTVIFQGDYWKPIQSGLEEDWDSHIIKKWIDPSIHTIHPPCYSLSFPCSPHKAARLSGIEIDYQTIKIPNSTKMLIIEGVGGVLAPLTKDILSLELFKKWDCQWILISNHYLGSINHTLLTVEILKMHQVDLRGVIFNGFPDFDSEDVILKKSGLPLLGALHPEPNLNSSVIKKYANLWAPKIYQSIH